MAAREGFSEIRATEKTFVDQRFGGFVVCRKGDRRGVGVVGCVGVATKVLEVASVCFLATKNISIPQVVGPVNDKNALRQRIGRFVR